MIARQYDTITNPNSPPPASVEGTWGWENLDEVKPQPGDTIVKKYRVDSFIGTNLDHILRWNGIRTIVILGAGAEAGIVPTVTHANWATSWSRSAIRPTSRPGLTTP
jgi:nicotinamidase-related amidase